MKPNEVKDAGARLLAAIHADDDEARITAAMKLLVGLCVNIAAIRAHLHVADKPDD